LLLLEVTDPVLCDVPADELDDFEPDDPEEADDATAVPLPIVVGVYCTPFRLAATSKTLPSLTSYCFVLLHQTGIPSGQNLIQSELTKSTSKKVGF
jgi:hypothetical protein